jgi:deaminated glutathione amidase
MVIGVSMGSFAVAGLQMDLRAEDNLARIATEVTAAKRRFPWIDLIILPELAAYGPSTAHAEIPGGRAERAFCQMARENQVHLLPGSLFQIESGQTFNVAPVIDPSGTVIARYRKMFPFRPFEEGVAAGGSFCVLPIGGAPTGDFPAERSVTSRLGVSICYDLWFPEVTRSLAWMGAEVLLCPSLTNTIDRDVELSMARASAAANQCYVINVNAGAPMGVGKSIVCGPGGEVIHQADSGYEVFAIDLDFDYVRRVRRDGWQGLGQPLKSFRDNKVKFPAYQDGPESPYLSQLGALTKRTTKVR